MYVSAVQVVDGCWHLMWQRESANQNPARQTANNNSIFGQTDLAVATTAM
jgi:hypothetical protein